MFKNFSHMKNTDIYINPSYENSGLATQVRPVTLASLFNKSWLVVEMPSRNC